MFTSTLSLDTKSFTIYNLPFSTAIWMAASPQLIFFLEITLKRNNFITFVIFGSTFSDDNNKLTISGFPNSTAACNGVL